MNFSVLLYVHFFFFLYSFISSSEIFFINIEHLIIQAINDSLRWVYWPNKPSGIVGRSREKIFSYSLINHKASSPSLIAICTTCSNWKSEEVLLPCILNYFLLLQPCLRLLLANNIQSIRNNQFNIELILCQKGFDT